MKEQRLATRSSPFFTEITHAAPAMGQAVSSFEGQRVGAWFLSFFTRARWRTGSLMQTPSLKVNLSGQAVISHWAATQTVRRLRVSRGARR